MTWVDLRSDGIVVRPWRTDDLAAFTALHHDQDVRRWSPAFEPRTAEQLREALERAAESGLHGDPGSFAVVADDQAPGGAAPGEVLGDVSYRLDLPTPPFSIADVGYAVLPSARGRGVASTALRLLTGWLLDPAGADLQRVQLDHAVENVGSCRTAARAGFVQEGVRRRYLPLRADADSPVLLHDTCLHGTTR
jgi:RimJ/RimL family protein N-acetyltransferase